eukprot:EC788561.1.p2 GENE.EC788561.1~~EC788561.1.p2  ORF type:complete len:124 (+),score=41.46 EC788561.1:37-408(+)
MSSPSSSSKVEAIKTDFQAGERWNRSMSQVSREVGSGVVVAALPSLLFARKRPAVALSILTFGAGFGAGRGLTKAEVEYQKPGALDAEWGAGRPTLGEDLVRCAKDLFTQAKDSVTSLIGGGK